MTSSGASFPKYALPPSEQQADSKARATSALFRKDIEGLRAVAVLAVLSYHAMGEWVPAGFVGVDIFFVISGFLITSLIIREVETTGRISLLRFWSRRAKRLLPATAVVLIFCAWVAFQFLPQTQRGVFGQDIGSASLYFVNWRLAFRSVDYMAEGIVASPVQHFWSLSVEEQYYVIWPLLVLLIVVLTTRHRKYLRRVLFVVLGVIASLSFAAAIIGTNPEHPDAFFVTQTRLWELAAGALVAIAARRLARLPLRFAQVLGGVGLLAILASIFCFSAATPWPSYAAALPVLGSAAVIAAGLGNQGGITAKILAFKPMVWLGGVSYSLYLWHWPFLIAAKGIWGDLAIWQSVLAVVASAVPAVGLHYLLENPVRFSKTLNQTPAFALSIGINCSLLGVIAGMSLVIASPPTNTATVQISPDMGAAPLIRGEGTVANALRVKKPTNQLVPAPAAATEDQPTSYIQDCVASEENITAFCVSGAADSKTRIALVGDSMAQQWEPTLDAIGKSNDLRIELYRMASCTFADATSILNDGPYRTCDVWHKGVLKALLEHPPAMVVMSQASFEALARPNDPLSTASKETMISGMHRYWEQLASKGIKLAVIAKNPGLDSLTPAYECVVQNPEELDRCQYWGIDETTQVQKTAVASSPVAVSLIDVNEYICTPDLRCPAVINDVVVYRQGSHLTKTYAETLLTAVEPEILKALER